MAARGWGFGPFTPLAEPDIELLHEALQAAETSDVPHIFTLASPPFAITHVNNAWMHLCGFQRAEAVGSTCRILQGPETNPQSLRLLRAAVLDGASFSTRLLNYTKDGRPFMNELHVRPLRNSLAAPIATHYVGTLRGYLLLDYVQKFSAPAAFQTQEEEEMINLRANMVIGNW